MSLLGGFGDLVSGIGETFGLVTKPLSDIYNIYANEKNYKFQRSQYDYQRDLQNQIFAREDSAVQRRMKDLKAAGMNPLLAAGGAAGTGQAVTVSAPQRGTINPSYADYMVAKAKADADISMTKAQQELLNDQAEGVRLNNELTRKTLKWYDDNPNFAPGVESGIYTGKGASSVFGAVSNRVAHFIDRNLTGPVIDAINWSPKVIRSYENAYNYHIKQGLSPKEADRRARKFVGKN